MIFEIPLLVALIILLCFLFFFVLLLTELPRTNGSHQGTDTSMKVAVKKAALDAQCLDSWKNFREVTPFPRNV
jgi:hypothetical protein